MENFKKNQRNAKVTNLIPELSGSVFIALGSFLLPIIYRSCHMVELERFRSLLSEEKQEKKGLAIQANDISASASCPRPWKMLCLCKKHCRVMLRGRSGLVSWPACKITLDLVS